MIDSPSRCPLAVCIVKTKKKPNKSRRRRKRSLRLRSFGHRTSSPGKGVGVPESSFRKSPSRLYRYIKRRRPYYYYYYYVSVTGCIYRYVPGNTPHCLFIFTPSLTQIEFQQYIIYIIVCLRAAVTFHTLATAYIILQIGIYICIQQTSAYYTRLYVQRA